MRRRLRASQEPDPAVARVQAVGRDVVVPFGEIAAVERQLEPRFRLEELALRAALLGDVAPDAAVAEEAALRVEARLARDDVDLARAALVAARDLEIEERQLLLEPPEVRVERARLYLDLRDLPEALAVGRPVAEERRDRRAAGQPHAPVPGVGFPEPVAGKLGEGAEALFVFRAKSFFPGGFSQVKPGNPINNPTRQQGEEQSVEHAATRLRPPAPPP